MRKLFLILPLLGIFLTPASGWAQWVDQYGRKEEKPKEERKPQYAIRNNVSDAAAFLAEDMMRRYYGKEAATLISTGFILANEKQRCKLGAELDSKVTSALAKYGQFSVIGADRATKQEQDLLATNKEYRNDAFFIKRIGRTQGASVLLMGTISPGNKVISISASLVDVETERTLSVSQVWIPKDKYSGDLAPQPLTAKKAVPAFKAELKYQVKTETTLADLLEKEADQKFAKYKSSVSESDLEKEGGVKAPAATDKGTSGSDKENKELTDEIAASQGKGTPAPPAATAAPEAPPAASPAPDANAALATPAPSEKGKGKAKEVDLDAKLQFKCGPIQEGDRVDVRFTVNSSGYAFLFSVDANGEIRKLYPSEERSQFSAIVDKGRPYLVPNVFNFNKVLGCKRVMLVVGDKPFKLEVDRDTLRRLACVEQKISIPVMKGFKPGTGFVQESFCFTQEAATKEKTDEETGRQGDDYEKMMQKTANGAVKSK